ncbi:MAG: orotate phosphoribosyltransferase [Clostridia bacterium]|nr:orotate phosphoribosyltransferase [Clostridia bacterium]
MKPSDQKQLISWLFETRALHVAPSDQPFWYTSGTFGPYYINTHFLYGNETAANELLRVIDHFSEKPLDLPHILEKRTMTQYAACDRYHQLMDFIVSELEKLPCDFISGGERRDFFFSICAASLLKKPHVSLFKDGSVVLTEDFQKSSRLLGEDSVQGKVALHVADLVTEASSYIRYWLPGLRRVGAKLPATLAVVDRNQNGRAVLEREGVRLISLITIEPSLFEQAAQIGLITPDQRDEAIRFITDPKQYMIDFLKRHPQFIEEQIAAGGKNKERALRFKEQQSDLAK